MPFKNPFKRSTKREPETSKDKDRLERTATKTKDKDPDLPTSPVSPSRPVSRYERKRPTISKPIEELVAILFREEGTTMDRIAPRQRCQEVNVWFNPKTFLISWFQGSLRGKQGSQIGQGMFYLIFSLIFLVDVAEIKEVRWGAAATMCKVLSNSSDA
jgi:hypothetical protein